MRPELTQNRPCWATIDAAALEQNLAKVRSLAPNSKVMAVIKADGYGHGMEVAAEALKTADEFAVNSLDDVHRLRQAGVDKPLTMLSPVLSTEQFAQLKSLGVRPVIYDWSQVELLLQLPTDLALPIWLKVDTGMGRLGFAAEELVSLLQRLTECQAISNISLMTHLANADQVMHSLNQQQLLKFAGLVEQFAQEFEQTSVLNSAGIFNFPEAAYEMVRPGIMLYGISPLSGHSAGDDGLLPVMSLKSRIVSVKTLQIGESVGYGSTFVCSRPTTIAVIACGYGDGYPRHAKQGTPVLVNGMLTELIGRVSMDMLTVDVTGLQVSVGDEAELWGANLPIETIAESAGTIAYELICSITSRVEKVALWQK